MSTITKGIILAAGKGTRLSPITLPTSKTLLPIYDRPMLYYPLAMLMESGIRDIMIITSEEQLGNFKCFYNDGSSLGIRITYAVQKVQRGISDAFIIAEDFIGDDAVILALGDNLFLGRSFIPMFKEAVASFTSGAHIFGYRVPDPRAFGVVEFDKDMNVLSLEEKPKEPRSDYAAVGLYIVDNRCISIAKGLELSPRGELEITDLNKVYLKNNELTTSLIGDDVDWIDAGSFDSLLDASIRVRELESTMGEKIMCPEISAVKCGYVSVEEMKNTVSCYRDNNYRKNILKFLGE